MKRLALALALLPLAASADVVFLKGGGRLEGRVEETPSGLTVRGRFGTVALKASQVESVRRQSAPEPPPAERGPSVSRGLEEIARDARPSVLRLSVYDASGREKGRGSAFLVSRDGIVTNRHVIAGGESAVACGPDGARREVLGVLGEDEAADLVLLRVPDPGLPPLPLGPDRPDTAGVPAAAVGYPHGGEEAVTLGELSRARPIPGNRSWIPFTGQAAPGSSGSPVLDARGEVVGVLKGERIGGGERSAFVIPVERVRALVDGQAAAEPRPLRLFPPLDEDALCSDPDWLLYLQAVRAGDLAERTERARALCRRRPGNTAAHRLLGDCGMEARDWAGALAAYREILRVRPGDAEAWFKAGCCLQRAGRGAEARDALRRAVGILPDHAEAWLHLGASCLDAGDAEGGREAWEALRDLDPALASRLEPRLP